MAVRALLPTLLLCLGCAAAGAAQADDVAAAALAAPVPQPPYTIAACAMFHNEAPYLREWVLYHYLIGIQHFFLYDNESDDDPQRELQPFVDRGLVTLTFWPLPQKEYVAQFAQVANCLNTTVGAPLASSEWMAAFDLDEMLVVLTQYPSAAPFAGLEPFALHELLSGFPESGFGAVHLDRYLFTSGGHRTRPPGLSMSAYVERDAFHGPWEHQGKVITLAAAFDSAAGFHDVILKPNWTMVHSNQRPWVDNEEFRTYEPVRVNHYGRSFEECMTKFQTGRLSADHWRVQFGAQLCREAMEGEPGYDKHRTSMDTTLQALGFPDVVRAMLRLVD